MMRSLLVVLCVACVLRTTLVSATVYFEEKFDDGKAWQKRWVDSTWKKDKTSAGGAPFTIGLGQYYGDKKRDVGLHTDTDYRFYAASAKMTKTLDMSKNDLVFQFSIRHPQFIECGGGSLKLFPPGTKQKDLSNLTPYVLQFGPDICGTSTRHVLASWRHPHRDVTIPMRSPIRANTDHLTHFYTLIVRRNGDVVLQMDGRDRVRGSLLKNWDWAEPPTIPDPSVKKPSDWIDNRRMHDPDDVKPEDWDDAVQGVWTPRIIDNPNYKGEWEAPHIRNPKYDAKLYNAKDKYKGVGAWKIGVVGLEIWQVKSGTVFDNILITDDESVARTAREAAYPEESRQHEQSMFDDAEKDRNEHAARIREEVEEARRKQQEEIERLKKEQDDL